MTRNINENTTKAKHQEYAEAPAIGFFASALEEGQLKKTSNPFNIQDKTAEVANWAMNRQAEAAEASDLAKSATVDLAESIEKSVSASVTNPTLREQMVRLRKSRAGKPGYGPLGELL